MSKTLESLKRRNPDKISGWYKEPRDGYWINLKKGWQWQECHAVHEWNVRDAIRSFKEVEPCDCNECKPLKAKAEDKSLDALFGETLPERAAPPVKAWWEASYIPQPGQEEGE